MVLLDWLFETEKKTTETRKKVFISFAIEDIEYRDFLVEQARKKHSPFDFIDMSVRKGWKHDEWQNEENMAKFKMLQKYKRINLVVPVDAEHMYFAAMESKSCKLSILGEHYWNLINKDRI